MAEKKTYSKFLWILVAMTFAFVIGIALEVESEPIVRWWLNGSTHFIMDEQGQIGVNLYDAKHELDVNGSSNLNGSTNITGLGLYNGFEICTIGNNLCAVGGNQSGNATPWNRTGNTIHQGLFSWDVAINSKFATHDFMVNGSTGFYKGKGNNTEWFNGSGVKVASVKGTGEMFERTGRVCTASNGICGGVTLGNATLWNLSGDKIHQYDLNKFVGIGKSNPSQMLSVEGHISIPINKALRSFGVDGFERRIIKIDLSENVLVGTSNLNDIWWSSGGGQANVLRLKNRTGYLGMVTTNPEGQIHTKSLLSTDVALVVEGASGQSADLLQFKDASGNVLAIVDDDGNFGINRSSPLVALDVDGSLRLNGNSSKGIFFVDSQGATRSVFVPDTSNRIKIGDTSGYNGFYIGGENVLSVNSFNDVVVGQYQTGDQSGKLNVFTASPSQVGVVITGNNSQSSDLLQVVNDSGTKIAHIDKDGYIFENNSRVCTASNGLCVGGGLVNGSIWNRTGTNVHLAYTGDNTGIGILTPNAKLYVRGTDATQDPFYVDNTTGTELFSVDRTGDINVGGKSIKLGNALRISDDVSTSYTYVNPQNSFLGVFGGSRIGIYSSTNNKVLDLRHSGTEGQVRSLNAGGGYTPLTFQTSDLNRLYITVDGNVGIGTITPHNKLEVSGDGNFSGTVYATNFSSNSPLNLQVGGLTRFWANDSSRSIGINTDTPRHAVEINGTMLLDGDVNVTGTVLLSGGFLGSPSSGGGNGTAWNLSGNTILPSNPNYEIDLQKGNLVYAGMYMNTTQSRSFSGVGTFMNVTGFNEGVSNLVTYTTDSFNIDVAGDYQVNYQISADFDSGDTYDMTVFQNEKKRYECLSLQEGTSVIPLGTVAGGASGNCILDLASGDEVTLRIADMNSGLPTINIFYAQLTIQRVGS